MFQDLSSQLGVNIWLLVIIIIWSAVWKLLAMWKAAKNNSPIWFVLLFVVNTIGILEILYFYVFSDMNLKNMKKEPKNKSKKK